MDKELHEMTRAELAAVAASIGGLWPPAYDAPPEAFDTWFVASFFIHFCRRIPDADRAKAAAANFLLNESRAELIPHIERALGRKLTPAEVANGISIAANQSEKIDVSPDGTVKAHQAADMLD